MSYEPEGRVTVRTEVQSPTLCQRVVDTSSRRVATTTRTGGSAEVVSWSGSKYHLSAGPVTRGDENFRSKEEPPCLRESLEGQRDRLRHKLLIDFWCPFG